MAELERQLALRPLKDGGVSDHPVMAVSVVDATGAIRYANDDVANMIGRPREELVGVCIFDHYPRDDADRRAGIVREVLRTGQPYSEVFTTTTGGKTVWGLAFVIPLPDPSGAYSTAAIVATDITRWRQAELSILQRNRELEVSNAVGQTLSSFLDLGEMLDRALAKTLEIVPADMGAVYLLDEPTGVLEMVAHRGVSEKLAREVQRRQFGKDITGRIAESGDTVLVEDATADSAERSPVTRHGEIRGTAGVPMRARGKVIGVLHVSYRDRHVFTPEEVRVYQTVANQMAAAVEHARLYQAARRRLAERERAEELLRRAREELEQRVAERTAELKAANETLRAEMAERRKAEETLQHSQEWYRRLFDDSPVAMIERDASALPQFFEEIRQRHGQVEAYLREHPEEVRRAFGLVVSRDANKAAVRLFRAPSREALLKGLGQTLIEGKSTVFTKALLAMARGESTEAGETVIRDFAGQQRHLLINFSLLAGYEKSLARGIVSYLDMTDLRRAERELAEQRQAAALQRMESLAATGRLAAGVAHEINNPLQGIVAQLRLLRDELPDAMRDGKRLRLLNESIQRIATIVTRLLQLHRRGADASAGRSAVARVVRGITELVSPMLSSQGVKLEVSIQPPDLTVPMTSEALTQVLLNLTLNAGDAMPNGGQLRIEGRVQDGIVQVSVSDNGTGIPPEHRVRLFSPFFTTKGPKGTGLGLAVTHSLVTEAGGSIDVLDRPGGGTTFRICFARSANLDIADAGE